MYIAGEDLDAGDVVSRGSDGQLYRVTPKFDIPVVGIVPHGVKRGELFVAITNGQFAVIPQRRNFFVKLWDRIRGKHYPYME